MSFIGNIFGHTNAATTMTATAISTTGTTTIAGPSYTGIGWHQSQPLPEHYTSDPMKQAIYEVLRAENPYNPNVYTTTQRIYRRITEKLLMEMWDVEGMIPAESAEERAAKAKHQSMMQNMVTQQSLYTQSQLGNYLQGTSAALTSTY